MTKFAALLCYLGVVAILGGAVLHETHPLRGLTFMLLGFVGIGVGLFVLDYAVSQSDKEDEE